MNEAFFICAQTDVPSVAWGDPGTGKTRSIEAFAKAMGRHCASISLSQFEATDIGGYPSPNKATNRVDFLRPSFIAECEDRPSILFMDELTTCSPGVQAAALRVLTHGLKNTWIVSAANPPSCAANGYPLEPPVVNRLYHHDWRVETETWVKDMIAGFPEKRYPVLPTDWQKHIPHCRAIIGAFLKHRPDMAQRMPENRDCDHGAKLAWPSYRSWTNAATLLAAARSLGYDSDNDIGVIPSELMSGCAGGGAVSEFFTWRTSLDLISPEELTKLIKTNKLDKKHISDRADKQMALISCYMSYCIQKEQVEYYKYGWELLNKCLEIGIEDIVVYGKSLLVPDTLPDNQKDKILSYANKDVVNKLTTIFNKVFNHMN